MDALVSPDPSTAQPVDAPAIASGIREKVARLESEMLKFPQVEIAVEHYFAAGAYVRSILIPRGVLATGKRHRHSAIHLVLTGSMRIITEGAGSRDVKAPCIFVSPPNSKMCGLAYEDTLWATAHATEETDIPTIEHELVYSPAELALMYPELALLEGALK